MSSRSADRADIESRLQGASNSISDRLEALQEEVATTDASLKQWAREQPFLSVGGAVVAGCAVGWFLSGARRRRRRRVHDRLLDRYTQAISREVEEALDEGTEPGAAVQQALRDRVPLVVFSHTEDADTDPQPGIIRDSVNAVLTTAISVIIQGVMENLADRVGGGPLGTELASLLDELEETP